ncbi:MAG: hypothetical protein ACYCQI_09155 [Gammaproteobacteria bacterium]
MKKNIILLIVVSLGLGGCGKPYSHEYLLSHPDVVQSELAACRKSAEYTPYCDMVKRTSDEFEALISVRADNQEAFGKQILQAEIDYAAAKERLQQARTAYQALKTKNPIDSNLKELHDKLEQAKQEYKVQAQKVQILFAVVATMTAGSL